MRRTYLNELLDKYQSHDKNKQERCIKVFINKLWGSKCNIEVYSRYYIYEIEKKLLGHRQDLYDLFKRYNNIEYKVCKSYYDSSLLESIDFIRIHINNMYTYLFNKEVYLNKKYYRLLKTPHTEYFKAIKCKDKSSLNLKLIESTIQQALKDADLVKKKSANKKFYLSWNSYQKLINGYIERIFSNYKSLEEYERDRDWNIDVMIDGWNEDNFIIGYFCKSLSGYMRNYINKLKSGEYIQCSVCEELIKPTNNRQKFCPTCWKEIRDQQNRDKALRYYHKTKNFTT